MTEKTPRMMSDESGERFQECLNILHKTQETLSGETDNPTAPIFDSLRIYMVAAAAYLARCGLKSTDEDLRLILHNMLEHGIDDYQFNERLYVGAKGAS